MKRKGLIYVISAPSGAGKTSICREILSLLPGLRPSISYTTRAMRSGAACRGSPFTGERGGGEAPGLPPAQPA